MCIQWAIPENIHIIPQMAFWNSKGKGGSLNWKSEGMRDTYNWNSKGKGSFRDRQEFIPQKRLFIAWFSWQMNWQHWQHRVQYKHRSIRQSMFLCTFVEENCWSSATADNTFWKVRRPGEGIKYGSGPWYGMDISWNCPLQYSCTDFIKMYQGCASNSCRPKASLE